ncbi:Kinase D-interacting substrate [Ilyonectria robusta]
MLDEEHEILPVGPIDSNTYTLGRIGHHNVVLACLPNYGIAKAAAVASHMLRSFPKIQIGLMVGIGGGVPGGGGEGRGGNGGPDIRLGDIVVGDLIVQYDLGKTDKQPVAQTARKSKPEGPPASPIGGSFALAEPLRLEYPVEELRAVDSATTVSTDTAENRLCIRSSMDADYIMTDDITLAAVTYLDFDFPTASLASTFYNYAHEEGHTYHSYGSKEYMLPNDEFWQEIEGMLYHVLHTLMLQDKALLGSVPDFDSRVLDVGTGTGIWAIESK